MHRSHVTEEPEETVSNESLEPAISQWMELRMTRRAALKGVAAAAVYSVFGCATSGTKSGDSPLTFIESGRYLDETHHVAPGYQVTTLIRWGDPLHSDAPAFDPQAQTATAQERQFGANNDFIAFVPLPRGSTNPRRGLLCVNNEYTTPQLMWPGYTDDGYAKNITREQCETEMAAQGHSIVEIENLDGQWKVSAGSAYNRRISALSTVMRVSGPASGHPRLATRAHSFICEAWPRKKSKAPISTGGRCLGWRCSCCWSPSSSPGPGWSPTLCPSLRRSIPRRSRYSSSKVLFLSIQHPGSEKGSTIDKPSTRWPDFRPDMPPRPSVLAITQAEGGDIGS